MSQQTSPWIEGAYGWDFGESNWNTGMDQNLLKFSFLFDRNVDGVVGSLPAAVNGEAYFLTADNRLYFAVGNTWFSTSVPVWFTFTIRGTGDLWQFNGTTAILTESPASIDARFDAIELSVTNLQAALNNATYVRQFLDIATLTTNGNQGRFANDRANVLGFYSTSPGIGGGVFWWDSVSVEAANNVTIFQVSGVATGRWKRFVGGTVYLDWAGVLADGVTTEEAKIQAAVDATPVGGTLVFPDRDAVCLVDMAAGQGSWPSSVKINKPMTVYQKNHKFTIKLKDFSTAWSNYVGVVSLQVVQITSSDVIVDGIHVDANADNHYEVDGSLFKHWEEGPTGVRPANGINVQNLVGAPRIRNVTVKNCRVDRPLGGVVASGTLSFGGPGLDDVTFFNGQMATDIISDCQFHNNTVYNARGNDYLFISGVRDSRIFNNLSVDSMYHQVRFYAGVDNCHAYGNQATVDYTRIGNRWNPTDLGYWRNDNPADPDYKMQRSGMTIGATAASTSANSGNLRRCSLKENIVSYADNTSGSAIADFTQDTMASFFSWVVTNGIEIAGNVSVNTPAHGLGAAISTVDPFNNVAQGVVISRNKVINAGRQAMRSIGTGIVFHSNEFVNCGTDGSGLSVVYVQGAAKVYRNTLVWQRTTANNLDIFEVVAYGPAGQVFISDNVVNGYTGSRLRNVGTIVVHGTDGGGVPLTLLNGWAVAQSGSPTIRNDSRVVIDCAGNVSLEGFVAFSAGTTNDQIFSSIGGNVMYRPLQNNYTGCIRVVGGSLSTVHTGRVTQTGNMLIDRAGVVSGDLFISAQWKTRPVI